MRTPGWLTAVIGQAEARWQAGDLTRTEAVTLIRDAIRDGDQSFRLAVLGGFAEKILADREKQPGGRRTAEAQSDLFPSLPLRLAVRPGEKKPLILMTGHDWDMARNMLQTRTTGAREGAERDWTAFTAAYDKVRPLLSGDLTTAEVAEASASPPEQLRPRPMTRTGPAARTQQDGPRLNSKDPADDSQPDRRS